jgi:hypothetical protein
MTPGRQSPDTRRRSIPQIPDATGADPSGPVFKQIKTVLFALAKRVYAGSPY